MNLFLFKKRKKCNPNFTEETALQLLKSNGYISAALLQREFGVGYAKVATMIDSLEEKGYIKHDGQRLVLEK